MATYAIVGTGAVGGYYGGLLQKAGKEVRFLVRSDYAHFQVHGLRVDSPQGDFRLERVAAYRAAESMPACDVAVIAWKSTENGRLAEVLPKVLKPGGVALVLQNGLDPERDAAQAAPDAKILSGLCFLCSRKAGPGWIQHLDYGAVTLAAYAAFAPSISVPSPGKASASGAAGSSAGAQGITPEMQSVAADLRSAGVDVRLHQDWRAARWRKLVWNIPFNGLSALLGTDTAQLMRHPPMRAQVGALIDEVIQGAGHCGISMPADFRDRMLKDTEAMKPYEPSMKLDRDAGRPMELDAIYRRPLEAIAEAGGSAPGVRALHAELLFLEGRIV